MSRVLVTIVAAAATLTAAQSTSMAADGWELVVLGIAQDAGIPQAGCQQGVCVSIRDGRRQPERVASIGVRHPASGRAYLFDATPDFSSQIHTLTGGRVPDAIFLTHAHVGHYTGLMYLGREAMNARSVPVYATARMTSFLQGNGPWSQLVALNNVDLRPIPADRTVELGDGLRVTPFVVPHRDEFSDTVGYLIEGPRRRALFIPDIDQWQKWAHDIRELANRVDLLVVDGTFASAGEIPGRSIEEIPHPLMPATRALLRGTRAMLWFIHLNHTNRELDAADVVRDGQRFPL